MLTPQQQVREQAAVIQPWRDQLISQSCQCMQLELGQQVSLLAEDYHQARRVAEEALAIHQGLGELSRPHQ